MRRPSRQPSFNGVRSALATGADPEERDALGYTALMRAADDGLPEGVRMLLEAGASVNARDHSKATAMHLGAEGGMEEHQELMRALIGRGADLEAADQFGWTPLHAAASRGHAEMVCLLLEAGASAAASDEDGKTPLAWAAMQGHEAASALLDDHALSRLAAKGEAAGPTGDAAPTVLSGRPLSAEERMEAQAAAKLLGAKGEL